MKSRISIRGEGFQLFLTFPILEGYRDNDWILTKIELENQNFSCEIESNFRKDEIVSFGSDIRTFFEEEKVVLGFSSMEMGLRLELKTHATGVIDGNFEVFDVNSSTRLTGKFKTDRTFLMDAFNQNLGAS